jgi:hypothetical protein
MSSSMVMVHYFFLNSIFTLFTYLDADNVIMSYNYSIILFDILLE